MNRQISIVVLLLLFASVFANAGVTYTQKPAGSDNGPNIPPRVDMRMSVTENCSGIHVLLVSSGSLGNGSGVPDAGIEVFALPRDPLFMVSSGMTGPDGYFVFNSSKDNITITATKDGYVTAHQDYSLIHPVCKPPPKLEIIPKQDCDTRTVKVLVLADSVPAGRAKFYINGEGPSYTSKIGHLEFPLAGQMNMSASFEGADASVQFNPEKCPAKDNNTNATAPPVVPPAQPPPAEPAKPSPPPMDLPLIIGLALVLLIGLFVIGKMFGKSQIGPGPMKGKSQIGPGPMKPAGKSQIGPGPMKPKEIGPGPM